MKNIFSAKKSLVFIGAIFILFIGIVIGSGMKRDNPVPNSDLIANVAEVAKEDVTENDNNIVVSESKADNGLVKVIRVIDGDTIEIEGGERVRYIGIDTPETVDPRKPVQCFGVEASRKNKELVDGKEVRLEKDITDKDKYGRSLRYVWVGETLINLELVKQGFANSYSYPPDIKYQDDFVKAEQEARDAKRGLWGATCQENINATTPIAVPSQTDTSASVSGSCVIKGNINSSGEMIYHLPGCSSYNVTKIDESRGERWFCSESEALTAGWRKALNCP